MQFFIKIDIPACRMWLKWKSRPFEIKENAFFQIWNTLKLVIFTKYGLYFWREISNVIKITKESLTFERNLPIP